MDKGAKPRKAKRQRIPKNCGFCRARKRKCDKKRPSCTYCLEHHNALNCFYEEPDTIFINEKESSTFINEKKSSTLINEKQNQTLMNEKKSPTLLNHLEQTRQPTFLLSSDSELSQHSVSILDEKQLKVNGAGELPTNDDGPGLDLLELQKRVEQLETILQRKANVATLNELKNLNVLPSCKKDALGKSMETIDEYIDFFEPGYAYAQANSMSTLKPFNRAHLFRKDAFYGSSISLVNRFYRKIKQEIKNLKISSDFSILTLPLTALLNENFKAAKFRTLVQMSLKESNPNFDIIINMIVSLFTSRKKYAVSLIAENNETERQKLVRKILNILPKQVSAINLLWLTFDKYVYPFAPFLDLDQFKQDIELIIVGLKLSETGPSDMGPSEYQINLTSFIDLALIANFLIILRISYFCLKINTEFLSPASALESKMVSLDSLNYIGTEYISLAFSCLAQCKSLTKMSISVLNATAYMLFYFRHCEEHAGSIDDRETSNLLGIVANATFNMGLFRDWQNVPFTHIINHPGCNFSDPEKTVYMARKIWYSIKKISVVEFACSGVPLALDVIKGQAPKLPRCPTLSHRDALVDLNFERQEKINILAYQIEHLIYYNETAKLYQVYDCYNAVNTTLIATFENSVDYFTNDSHFANHETAIPRTPYYIVLDKVFQLEQFLLLNTLSFKLGIVFLYHYQEKNDLSNYFHYLKQLTIRVSVCVNVYSKLFQIENRTFLKVDEDLDLKNFNYRIISLAGKLILDLSLFLYTTLFQIYVSIYLALHSGNHIQAQALIPLKKAMLKSVEILLKTHFFKTVLFYYQHLKVCSFMSLLLAEFKRCDAPNDRGEDIEMINVLFMLYNSQEKKSLHFLGMKYNLEPIPRDSVFLSFSEKQLQLLVEILTSRNAADTDECSEAVPHLDGMIKIVQTSHLYDTLTDTISLKDFAKRFATKVN